MSRKSKPTDILYFDGKKCSRIYTRMLGMAREDGVHFRLNSGYRSVAEQWKLWYAYKRGQGPIAAFPGSSTHNKRGYRQGLDINALDGGAERVRKWAAKHGITLNYTVPGESWHLNAATDYTHKIYTMQHLRTARKKAAAQHKADLRRAALKKRKKGSA